MEFEKPITIQLPSVKLAPPGISGDFVLVSDPGPPNTDPSRFEDREERDFEVYCLLSRDAGFAREIPGHFDPLDGTSFFAAPAGADQLKIQTPSGEYRFVINARREYSGVIQHCRACSIQEARTAFLRGVAPVLDHLAYLANTPLMIGLVLCVDKKNRVELLGYTSPYHNVVVNSGTATLSRELIPIYALYREAKNSSSHFYRFLCYYKILEGIFSRLRGEVFARAKQKGLTLKGAKEVIPDHPELRQFQPHLIGRSIKEYVDNVLQKEFRDTVAHYILDNSSQLNPSDPETTEKFHNVILPIELCCRVAISQQEEYFKQLETAS